MAPRPGGIRRRDAERQDDDVRLDRVDGQVEYVTPQEDCFGKVCLESSLCVGVDVNAQLDFKTCCSEAGTGATASAEKVMNVYGQSSPPVK